MTSRRVGTAPRVRIAGVAAGEALQGCHWLPALRTSRRLVEGRNHTCCCVAPLPAIATSACGGIIGLMAFSVWVGG